MKKKTNWCKKQKKGIELIKPNDNLSDSYIKDADNSLLNLEKVVGKWKVIIGYYACYNALYSILMKAGIKCEIHDCTIELIKLINQFSEEDYNFIQNLKQDRINSQYYLKQIKLNTHKVKSFVLKCKMILEELNIKQIREEVMSYPKK